MELSIILALSPIVLLLAVLLRKPLVIVGPIVFLYTLILSLVIWKMDSYAAFASSLKGLFLAMDILIIIFGALFFLEVLKSTGIINNIRYHLSSLSSDRRVQAIILVWFLGSFIEGIAGFGTPAAIIAPLLVGLGFSPLISATIALIGNSTAVAFGALGTPIRIGLAGFSTTNVVFYTAMVNIFVGLLVPIMILGVIVLSDKKRSWKLIYEALPFAFLSGICFTVPYFLFSFLGSEFPSIFGSLAGLLIISFFIKMGIGVPKNIWSIGEKVHPHHKNMFKALMPYVILIALLILGKYLLPSFELSLTTNIAHKINLFNPGFALILATVILFFVFNLREGVLKESSSHAAGLLFKPFLVILCLAALVQMMVNSGINSSGMPSMVQIIAQLIDTPALIFLSPFIGAFGAFVAGSATVSNILFSPSQFTAASLQGLNSSLILALQTVGAGAGNMIALTNIIAAQAMVKLHGKEGDILKRTIIPCIIYLVFAGIVGIVIAGLG